ncbi:DUF4157 domain-containing protein [Pseudomonas sp. BN415]|uniref:eCIS core domain-containing protein n=1 Tax=Pseudomonas sp. BN415 TaxID=2567889 RepID=UPI0024566A0E|nr:DUF4157 domain-containing protein [Pseudomonas sp. BN415]
MEASGERRRRADQPTRASEFLHGAAGRPAQDTPAGRPCACGGVCPRCGGRGKLAISEPGDRHEQEADRVAAEVMAHPPSSGVGTTPVQIQRHGGSRASEPQTAPESVERTLASPGQALEPGVQANMEQRFGHPFADVRVHRGGEAEHSAREVAADAYAVGRDIVFGAGQYAPDTLAGQQLIAHELTHVVQHRGAPATGAARSLSRYRSKGPDTIAFDAANETLTDPKKQPWVETINIHFDKAVVDSGHKADAKAAGQPEPRMPTGSLVAKYSSKSSKVLADVKLPIAGGSTMLGIGLTDRVKSAKVKRLEGLGYTDSENVRLGNLTDPVAKTGKGARYSKSGAGTMNYAIFFKGIQAIHEGLLNTGSHACVHVGNGTSMRDLNYHTRVGVTTVTVSYDSSVLSDLCCHRKKTGNTNWDTNPCESTKCP